ncbi:spermidine synthase [Acrasis kona]|uniref:Spermidine synthase n=1 Tax=Acrasis kona TaxID=1008807 RepID=A0AAW2YIN7_9EUKA
MNAIGEGWFSEISEMWPGQAASLKVKSVLHKEKSNFQDIIVFESETYGKVLVLDGVIQLTERDEFAYQEMITHVPLCSHPNPKRVCLIGGGDGGVIREVMRHECVEEIYMCEIDERVLEVSKAFFPKVSEKLINNPKLKLFHCDGAEFLKREQFKSGFFDVIIVDCSDPVGPAESLFGRDFYESAQAALNQGGVLCAQAESMWLHLDIIADMAAFISEINFKNVEYSYTMIPTYPSGSIGFFVCRKGDDKSCSSQPRVLSEEASNNVTYYTPQIHCASFVLPKFAHKAIYKHL